MTITITDCPFCGATELQACTCFSDTKSSGKIKPECEWCSG